MKGHSKTNFAVAVVFLLGLCLPLLWQALPTPYTTSELKERRSLAEWPVFSLHSISTYPARFDRYFNDHFGFRNALIHLNTAVRYHVFKSSGSPKVLVGKEGWLFYNANQARDGASLSNHLGLLPTGYNEIFRGYKEELEQKRNYLASRGIRYVFVIAPDKWTVYPEYLPDGFANFDRSNNVDLLVDYLSANTNVEIIDLRKVLIDAKRPGQHLYYKTDTHWNELGAFFAYQAISKNIARHFPEIRPRSINDFYVSREATTTSLELGEMLLLKNLPDTSYKLLPKKPYAYVDLTEGKNERDILKYQRVGINLPKALVFRDSFMGNVIPYLSDDFSQTTYLWSTWNPKTDIDSWLWQISPDIVIEERVERYLVPGIALAVF